MEMQPTNPVPPHRRRSLVAPVVLIILGLAFLAQNLGLIDFNIWSVLWRLWPVWLIAAGLDLLLGRRTDWGSWLVVGLVVLVAGGAIWYGSAFQPRAELGQTMEIHQPVGRAQKAEVKIEAGISQLSVRSGNAANLVEGSITPLSFERVKTDAQESGETLTYTVKSQGGTFGFPTRLNNFPAAVWDLRLSPAVEMKLAVDTGVGESEIDLSGLKLSEFKLNTGIGDTEVTLPAAGRFKVDVDSGVGNLTIRIPKALAARIQADNGIGNVQVHGDLDRSGKTYESRDWAQAQNRVEIEIDGGVGDISVEKF